MLINDTAPVPEDLLDDSVLVPAGSAQRGRWITQELDPASPAYAVRHAFELTGRLDDRLRAEGVRLAEFLAERP